MWLLRIDNDLWHIINQSKTLSCCLPILYCLCNPKNKIICILKFESRYTSESHHYNTCIISIFFISLIQIWILTCLDGFQGKNTHLWTASLNYMSGFIRWSGKADKCQQRNVLFLPNSFHFWFKLALNSVFFRWVVRHFFYLHLRLGTKCLLFNCFQLDSVKNELPKDFTL